MLYYTAFGMILDSEFELPQVLPNYTRAKADVTIKRANLSEKDVPSLDQIYIAKNDLRFTVEDLARFRITNGNLIEVFPITNDFARLPIFLLGSCMGAIFHQRGLMPLHGSCVTNGTQTILLTGDSGAGKSTLASVFVKHGWKILTDDVALIRDPEGEALVQPSYPSQKLWEDSPEMSGKEKGDIHALYQRDEKKKYGVFVKNVFLNEPKPLTTIVKLVPAEIPTQVSVIENFAKVDQIMRNTYRDYYILREDYEAHFQKCVTLATKVRMMLAVRNVNEESREKLYSLICGEKENDTVVEEGITMKGETVLKRKENMITADMLGSAVTMDMKTGQYYDLGETGGAIWNLLKDEKTYDSLIDDITKEYDVSREECEADVEEFLQKLIGDGLIIAK